MTIIVKVIGVVRVIKCVGAIEVVMHSMIIKYVRGYGVCALGRTSVFDIAYSLLTLSHWQLGFYVSLRLQSKALSI